jgi:hypothetical protein
LVAAVSGFGEALLKFFAIISSIRLTLRAKDTLLRAFADVFQMALHVTMTHEFGFLAL